jgi:hypothetical protein
MKGFRREFIVCLAACVLLSAWSGFASAYTVSGTVTNNTDSAGRVFLRFQDNSYGVSVEAGAKGSASYTIHGVPDGIYTIKAFLDLQGTATQYANSPKGSVGITVSGADATADTITVNTPSSVSLSTTVTPYLFFCPPYGVIMWDSSSLYDSGSERLIPESLKVYYGAGSLPSSPNKTVSLTGYGRDVIFLSGLSAGATLYVKLVPVVNGSDDETHAGSSSATIAAPVGTGTVTGYVNSPAVTKSASTPLYIGMRQSGGSGFYCAAVSGPADRQAYTLTGVAPGTYSLYAILDMDNDALIDFGDSFNDGDKTKVTAVASSSVQAPDITLTPAANADARLRSVHGFNYSGYSEWYAGNLSVKFGAKLPVNVQVVSCSGVDSAATPIDLKINRYGEYRAWLDMTSAPSVGDSCTLNVTFSDGSETFYPSVKRALGVYDGTQYPYDLTGPGSVNPLFYWMSPGAPGYFDYKIQLYSDAGNIWFPQDSGSNITAVQNYAQFNYDSSATQTPLSTGVTYYWDLVVEDFYGNQAICNDSFTPQGSGPVVTGFTPSTGSAGDTVTIYGSGFDSSEPGNNMVYFGDIGVGPDTVTAGDMTVTVPEGAQTGPLVVELYDSALLSMVYGGSTSVFTPTITFTASAEDKDDSPLDGITVSVVGLDGYYTVASCTTSSGSCELQVPASVPLTYHLNGGSYLDVYSARLKHTADDESTWTLRTSSNLTGKGVTLTTGKGLIAASVRDWDSDERVEGASVTALSSMHPDTPYTVVYTDGSGNVSSSATSTASDGKFYVQGVDHGDYVMVTAAVTGWGFQTRTYIAHADSVSQQNVRGTLKPTVTLTTEPEGPPYYSPLTVTLTGDEGCDSGCFVRYTLDGSDPRTASGIEYNEPFNLTENTTLKYYAENDHGIEGDVVTAELKLSSALTANSSGTGSGTLSSDTEGVSCSGGSCSGNLSNGTEVVITATADSNSIFIGWTGCDSVDGNVCTYTITADSTVTANFQLCSGRLARIKEYPDVFYADIKSAYDNAKSGETVQLQQVVFDVDNLDLNSAETVTLLGGFNCAYAARDGFTDISGKVTIKGNAVKMDGIRIK